MNSAVFLDKDGTLIPDIPYNVDPALIELMPGAVEGLQRLHAEGYQLIVVSNQSGVARGYFPEAALIVVEWQLRYLFEAAGVALADFYYCPHYPQGDVADYVMNCTCRKPAPGMLLQAAIEHDIDLSHSWMVGDILNDVEAGRRAGCHTILVDNGHETEWLLSPLREPHYRVSDLREAAEVITGVSEVPIEAAPETWIDAVPQRTSERWVSGSNLLDAGVS